jgi:hypothetical protein
MLSPDWHTEFRIRTLAGDRDRVKCQNKFADHKFSTVRSIRLSRSGSATASIPTILSPVIVRLSAIYRPGIELLDEADYVSDMLRDRIGVADAVPMFRKKVSRRSSDAFSTAVR